MIGMRGVVKKRGSTLAVDGVDIDIAPGITAIIGPNGAGKSTLLAVVGRLLDADEGTVIVGDLDVHSAPTREVARRLAILRQDNNISIRLTLQELVELGRFPHGGMRTREDRMRVEESIELLQLEGLRARYLDELSGGQRQRAFIAMALAQQADYLLLDEPLNSLDPRHVVALMALLRDLADARGMTIVIVMHDVNTAAHHADRILMMKDGRVLGHGATSDVITAARLSELYDTVARVENISGRRIVLWER